MKDLLDQSFDQMQESTEAQIVQAVQLREDGKITESELDRIIDNAYDQRDAWCLHHEGVDWHAHIDALVREYASHIIPVTDFAD